MGKNEPLSQITSPQGIGYVLHSQNQGIAESKIILIMEAWLDKVRQNFKDKITKGMEFGN